MHHVDLQLCNCGEISVDGGPAMRCAAKNWDNFLRVDDEGNEIVVTVLNGSDVKKEIQIENSRPTKKDLLEMLDATANHLEKLPPDILYSNATNADILQLIMLISALFKVS